MAVVTALLAGSFSLIGPAAKAGDKIEFSAASPLLEVPQVEREYSADPVAALRASFSSRHKPAGEAMGSVMPTIIIPLQKPRDRFGWHAPFEEDPDQDDNSGLDLFASKKVTSQTKTSSMDSDSDLSKDGAWTRSAHDLSRLGMTAVDKGSDSEEDGMGGRFHDHALADWFQALQSHEKPAGERVQVAATPWKDGAENFNTFYHAPISEFSLHDPLGPLDSLRTSASASARSRRESTDFGLRDQSEALALTPPVLPRAWDELPSAARLQRPAARSQFAPAASRAPAAPAVLSFPKRPGSLFQ